MYFIILHSLFSQNLFIDISEILNNTKGNDDEDDLAKKRISKLNMRLASKIKPKDEGGCSC